MKKDFEEKLYENLDFYLTQKVPFHKDFFDLLESVHQSSRRDVYISLFIKKLLFRNGKSQTFFKHNLKVFERLFGMLKYKKRYPEYFNILFDKYFHLMDHTPRQAIKKISLLLESVGTTFEDLGTVKQRKILLKLKKETIITFYTYLNKYKKGKSKRLSNQQ